MLHMASYEPGERGTTSWQPHGHRLLGSGRDALRLSVASGNYGRVWISSYACQDLFSALRLDGVDVRRYPDDPLQATPNLECVDLQRGDAVIVTNYFGLREPFRPDVPDGVGIIEDHTHDPGSEWALRSRADYCFASLRKLWPLPDGGVVWTPCGAPLDVCDRVAPHMHEAVNVRMTGMLHRRLFLEGHSVDKQQYRQCLREGEQLLVREAISAMTPLSRGLLGTFPLASWRQGRAERFRQFRDHFTPRPGVRLLSPQREQDTPFAAMLLFEEEEDCERVRQSLASRGVFASRLWPQDCDDSTGIRPFDHALSHRLCALPLDMRYSARDVDRALQHLHDVL